MKNKNHNVGQNYPRILNKKKNWMLVMAKIAKQIIKENIFWNLGDEEKVKGCAFFKDLFF